mgnify:CR=1 FL=1
MFRCQSVAWSLLVWSMIFSYTILTYLQVRPAYRVIPLGILFCALIILISLVAHVAKQTKGLLIFSSWCFFTLVAFLLRTLDVITDWHLNIIIALFTALAAIVWCIVGHVDNVTESGLFWHVWSILSVLSILCAFNNDTHAAIVIYTVNAGVLSTTHILYIRHILIEQTRGPRRCRHLFRTVSCFTVVTALLVGSLFYKSDIVDEIGWQEWVIVTEVGLLVALTIDGILGFTQPPINDGYDLTSTDDELI